MIEEGAFVILKKGKTSRLNKVVCGKSVTLEKTRFFLDKLIGYNYNRLFSIQADRHLQQCEADEVTEYIRLEHEIDAIEEEGCTFADDEADAQVQSNQLLSFDQVVSIKSSGVGQENLVQTLVDGSLSYKRKSTLAKHKYVVKKRRKHYEYVLVKKPNVRLLADVYFHKGPQKMLHLRYDHLSTILCLANVEFGSKILLLDNCCGLLAAAVLQRLAGCGTCLQLHFGDQCQSVPCLEAMQYPADTMRAYKTLPLLLLDPVALENEQNKKLRCKYESALSLFRAGEFDSFILASGDNFTKALVESFLPAVRPSGCIAIYCDVEELSVDYFELLQSSEKAIEVELINSHVEEYQILPERTHPDCYVNLSSGRIISAVAIA